MKGVADVPFLEYRNPFMQNRNPRPQAVPIAFGSAEDTDKYLAEVQALIAATPAHVVVVAPRWSVTETRHGHPMTAGTPVAVDDLLPSTDRLGNVIESSAARFARMLARGELVSGGG